MKAVTISRGYCHQWGCNAFGILIMFYDGYSLMI
jgi:hypothetical protein